MIYVIGIGIEGRDGLGKRAAAIIDNAGLIVAGARHLEDFRDSSAQKVIIKTPLESAAKAIEKFQLKSREDVAIIATGDPLLFGIADFILKRFERRDVAVIPGVSVVQSAFARIKESMNGVTILSVHSAKEEIGAFAQRAARFDKLAVFTSPQNSPASIAAALIGCNAHYDDVYVVESLGMNGEKVIKTTLEKVVRIKKFAQLNLMILLRGEKGAESGAAAKQFGLPDPLFAHSNGMITKEELRVVVLSKLDLTPDAVVWDIGAGSGSVAIEAARLAPLGRVYAFEKNAERVRDILENKKRFKTANLNIIKGVAPECIKKETEAPDAVFVGGGGADMAKILSFAVKKIKKHGTIVVNAVTMETASIAYNFFNNRKFNRELVMMNISKARPAGRLNILGAMNPVFIIRANLI